VIGYRELLAWFTRVLASDAFSVVALDGRGALVAGRLRGVLPHPSAKRDRRSKTMRQASWLLDIRLPRPRSPRAWMSRRRTAPASRP